MRRKRRKAQASHASNGLDARTGAGAAGGFSVRCFRGDCPGPAAWMELTIIPCLAQLFDLA
jgi:hypothetical protein